MPPIKIQHVVSFSSEDKVHKAENLLKEETYRKWKCATPGEKQVSAILQLEKAYEIHSVDIGNEHSSFVEVLVSRSSDSQADFKVLLVASSFMTPMESRNGTNPNRVRMFGFEKLSQTVAKEKWDRVKVVCTQPFNKNVQYGLSFITLHSPPDTKDSSSGTGQKGASALGKFVLKDDDDAEDDVPSIGSWFTKRKEQKDADSQDASTSPAAIRGASFAQAKLAESKSPLLKNIKLAKQKDNQVSGDVKEDKRAQSKTPSKGDEKDGSSTKATKQKKNDSEKNVRRNQQEGRSKPPERKEKEKKKAVPFHSLMKKVVFVLSGFQNPFRSELREKALDMGAKYKADWDRSCTLLICAFVNTPKYNQVKSYGARIVSKEWILDCHKKKQLLPWRDYKLGKYKSDVESESSDEEEVSTPKKRPRATSDDEEEEAASPSGASRPSSSTTVKKTKQGSPRKRKTEQEEESGGSVYDASTDVDTEEDSEARDTEDEIERTRQENVGKRASDDQSRSPRKRAKEEDKPDTSALALPDLPDFFKGRSFFLYGDFDKDELRTLRRYIIGHDGSLEDYMSESVKYVITNSDWSEHFDEALSENENLIFVRPKWIARCHEAGKVVPYQPFVVCASF